ncbi:MAG: hypothetical protein ABIP64_15180, partial [Burkholderiales bacterium]
MSLVAERREAKRVAAEKLLITILKPSTPPQASPRLEPGGTYPKRITTLTSPAMMARARSLRHALIYRHRIYGRNTPMRLKKRPHHLARIRPARVVVF